MKPSFVIRIILFLLVGTICSCKSDDDKAPYLTVNATSLTFSTWASNKTVAVQSNVSFTAVSSQPDWCEVTAQSGAIKISVTENPSAQERTAEIHVTGSGVKEVTVTVTQTGAEPVFMITEGSTDLHFLHTSSAQTLTLAANVEVSLSSSQTWCRVELLPVASGNLKITVDENTTNDARTATVTVASEGMGDISITVTQDGVPGKYVLITCGQDQIYIIDEKTSNGSDLNILWSWKLAEAMEQLPFSYLTNLRTLDECKSVDNNTKLLLTSSTDGGVLLLERATKKCLFYAYTPQAHSAEWLPDGKIAVTLSTNDNGNRINIYDSKVSEQVLFTDALYGGHGALWIPERNRLYALGALELREYSLKDWETSSPKLVREKTWSVPTFSGGGHDLSRVNVNTLLVSAGSVYSFSLETETFTPFRPDELFGDIKSVNYVEEDDWVVYTQAGEVDYWNHYIYMLNPDKILTLPADYRMYKVRLMEK